MTTADWALLISICSAAISLAGFIWNVWSKFIYPKPRVDVSFNFMAVVSGGKKEDSVLGLSATNMGPASVTLYCVIADGGKDMVAPQAKGVCSAQSLARISVETRSFHRTIRWWLPKNSMSANNSRHISFRTMKGSQRAIRSHRFCGLFGRHHWASKDRRQSRSTANSRSLPKGR
jgi:hypothetical protein